MNKIIAGLVGAAAGVTLGMGGMAIASDRPDVGHQQGIPGWVTRPCPSEDSLNCAWNAQVRGDGDGKSFVIRRLPHTGKRHPLVCQFFANRAEAHFDQCWRYDGGGM